MMKALPNFDFASITSFDMAIEAIEKNILLLAELVREGNFFTEQDSAQFVVNILWIKRFFETAEQYLYD
jgi:hypothetical protein